METPFKAFKHPFNANGTPKKYLSFIIPLLYKNNVTREEMLRSAGVNPKGVSKRAYSDVFSQYTGESILKYDDALHLWKRGSKWWEFMAFVLCDLCKHDVPYNVFSTLMKQYGSTAVQFIDSLHGKD